MKTNSKLLSFAVCASTILAASAAQSQRRGERPERTVPAARTRTSYNYVHNRPQMEHDFRQEHSSGQMHVHGTEPHENRNWGGHWRYGYTNDHRFDSHDLRFGAYLYSPFIGESYPSPWYYYPSLPPYVAADQVVVVPSYGFSWGIGAAYPYPARPNFGGDDPALDGAVMDIQGAFSQSNLTAADALVPPDSQVAIFQDGHYEYSLHGAEFMNMISDNLNNTETQSFRVNSVRRTDSDAVVRATQVVKDPDGAQATIRLEFHLHRSGDGYVITDFGSSE